MKVIKHSHAEKATNCLMCNELRVWVIKGEIAGQLVSDPEN